MDDPERDKFHGKPNIVEFGTWIRYSGRRKSVHPQNGSVVGFEIDPNNLGHGAGPLFVFGGHGQDEFNRDSGIDENETKLNGCFWVNDLWLSVLERREVAEGNSSRPLILFHVEIYGVCDSRHFQTKTACRIPH